MPIGDQDLTTMLDAAPYLAGLAARYGAGAGADGLVAAGLAQLRGLRVADAQPSRAAVMAGLRQGRGQVALGAALGDLAEGWPIMRVTRALSDLADTALQVALGWALAEKARIFSEPVTAETCGLLILAMGKHGARELNFSSDIDLIVIYDPALVPLNRPDRMGIETERLTREIMALLETRTADGFVARTDLRLRPDPASTPAAVPLPQAEIYYTSLARTWERAAMIKARPVAGDLRVWQAMQPWLSPFIWRRSLDYLALEDVLALKSRMRAEKGLEALSLTGANVKLGRGGIRDIEFHVQALQLIHGGRDASLRSPATLDALAALAAAGHVPLEHAEALEMDYALLRRVEHGLQMAEDRQTHSLPDDEAGITALGAFLGLDDLPASLRASMSRVDALTAAMGPEEGAAPASPLRMDGPEITPDALAALARLGYVQSDQAAALVQGWMYGRLPATRSQRARQLLARILPRLLEKLAFFGEADAALGRFDAFLSRQVAGADLFALLDHNPALIDLLAEITGRGGWLAEQLAQSPRLLDLMIGQQGPAQPLPDGGELLATLTVALNRARDYQDVLDLSRRWLGEQHFLTGLHILRGTTSAKALGHHLADMADLLLTRLVAEVQADFAQRHGSIAQGQLALLVFGKFGGRAPALSSDLDLVIVYEAPDGAVSDGDKPLDATSYYARLIRRILTAITARTGEGRLYEVDTRLRPSGNSGPLAVSLEAFARYQRADAWVWEHMALTRARAICGDATLIDKLAALRVEILTKPRDKADLLAEIASMRQRMADHHGRAAGDIKHGPGGLVDIEFIAQYHMLACADAGCLSPDTATALQRLAEAGHMAPDDAATLCDALEELEEARHRATVLPADIAQGIDDSALNNTSSRSKAAALAARLFNLET